MKKCPKCDLNWIQDNDDICICCEPQISVKKSNAITFYDLDLRFGDVIEFTKNPKYKATISTERTLWFENEEYTHTKLGVMLLKRIGNPNAEQLGSGLGVFRFDDKDRNLVYRYLRLHDKK